MLISALLGKVSRVVVHSFGAGRFEGDETAIAHAAIAVLKRALNDDVVIEQKPVRETRQTAVAAGAGLSSVEEYALHIALDLLCYLKE